MTHEKLLDELKLCAEIFIRSSTDNGEDVLENYQFTFEELVVFLTMFADGAIEQVKRNEISNTLKQGQKDLEAELKAETKLEAKKQPHLGSVSTCVQCDNFIQFDGKVWFHVNGALRHAAIPARTANTQKADSQLNEQLVGKRQPLESAAADDFNSSIG